MRKSCISLSLLFILLVAQVSLPPSYEVIGVSIICDGKLTTLRIETTRRPTASYSYLTSPLRIKVDFENAILKMDSKLFETLPEGLVSKVKVAQFRGGKNPVVRVVFYVISKGEGISDRTAETSYEVEVITRGYPVMKWSSEAAEIPPAPPPPKPAVVESLPAPPKPTITPEVVEPESIVPPPPGKAPAYRREPVKFIPNKIDPFKPQTPLKERPLGARIYPDVGGITLVGIIRQGTEFKALVEDKFGFGYLLGEGDSVESGRTVAVDDSSVTFIVEEFGWRRKIRLGLRPRGRK